RSDMAFPRHLHGAWMKNLKKTGLLRSRSGGGLLGRGRGGRLGLEGRVQPAGMHAAVEGFLRLRVDISLADQAAERGLDMRAWTAEAVVEIEVAEGGIEVVTPQQGDHPAAEPDAFGVAGRAGKDARSLGNLVDFLLAFLGGGVRRGRLLRLGRLAAALG